MARGLGAQNMTTTTDASYIQTLWADKLNDFYRANLIAANFFEDLSDEAMDGGNVIYIPNISQMTANTKTITSQVTLNYQTAGKITLTINTWKEVSFLLEDFVAAVMKRSYKMQERWMKNAGYTVAATLEDALLTLFSGFSQTVGDSSHSLNDSSIRAAIAYLDAADVPAEDRAFFLHPNVYWKHVAGINKFTLATNAPTENPVTKGYVGSLYGIPIYLSSRVTKVLGSYYNALAGKDALNYATVNVGGVNENQVRLQSSYIQEYLGTLVTADIMFGVIENRDTSGVLIKASS